jgi:hypothetical protein
VQFSKQNNSKKMEITDIPQHIPNVLIQAQLYYMDITEYAIFENDTK